VLRDVVADQPSVLLNREIYVSAAILAATTHVVLWSLGVQNGWAVLAALLLGFGLRAGALLFHWRLPQFKPREGSL
jgi:uncharacterized membrane protein YeiH